MQRQRHHNLPWQSQHGAHLWPSASSQRNIRASFHFCVANSSSLRSTEPRAEEEEWKVSFELFHSLVGALNLTFTGPPVSFELFHILVGASRIVLWSVSSTSRCQQPYQQFCWGVLHWMDDEYMDDVDPCVTGWMLYCTIEQLSVHCSINLF